MEELNETGVETTYQLISSSLALDTNSDSAKSLVIHVPKYVHQAAINCQVMRKKRRLRIDFREMRSESTQASIVNKWDPLM